jgi:hypothetical protein
MQAFKMQNSGQWMLQRLGGSTLVDGGVIIARVGASFGRG